MSIIVELENMCVLLFLLYVVHDVAFFILDPQAKCSIFMNGFNPLPDRI